MIKVLFYLTIYILGFSATITTKQNTNGIFLQNKYRGLKTTIIDKINYDVKTIIF